MKGAHLFLICVLLIVLAIPLFAGHDLVNPVVEFSAISTINNEEVSFSDQELTDNNVPVLSVGLKISYLLDTYERLYANADIGNGSKKYNTNSTNHGGVKRTNLRKH